MCSLLSAHLCIRHTGNVLNIDFVRDSPCNCRLQRCQVMVFSQVWLRPGFCSRFAPRKTSGGGSVISSPSSDAS